jgi:hypothetical protein
MKSMIIALLLLGFTAASAQKQNDVLTLDVKAASHFASLAMECMQQEYPNKLNQVVASADDLKSPSTLHPAFYGCFDWHSSVHGHWMLVKLLKTFPNMPEAKEIRKKLNENLTAANLKGEMKYFINPTNKLFERTYGWGWLLKLAEELKTWEDADGQKWAANLKPLSDVIANRYIDFLSKLTYPVRTGEHANTAFGMSLAWDYAKAVNNSDLQSAISKTATGYFSRDAQYPAKWEPSGFDFLSPSLEEAALMSRIMPAAKFYGWVEQFLPGIAKGTVVMPYKPAIVSDRTDGKIVHLDGLNLSRAWCLYRIAAALEGDKPHLTKLGDVHLKASIPHIKSGDYAGEHWLASFAVMALTTRNSK